MVISLRFISWSLAQRFAHGIGVPGDGAACSSEKIFARAVAEECGGEGPTLDWTAFTGEVFVPWQQWISGEMVVVEATSPRETR